MGRPRSPQQRSLPEEEVVPSLTSLWAMPRGSLVASSPCGRAICAHSARLQPPLTSSPGGAGGGGGSKVTSVCAQHRLGAGIQVPDAHQPLPTEAWRGGPGGSLGVTGTAGLCHLTAARRRAAELSLHPRVSSAACTCGDEPACPGSGDSSRGSGVTFLRAAFLCLAPGSHSPLRAGRGRPVQVAALPTGERELLPGRGGALDASSPGLRVPCRAPAA